MPKSNSGLLTLGAISTFPAPEISSVTPNQLNRNTTQDITIQGNWFTSSTTVAISGQTVNSVTVVNSITLVVNVTTGNVAGFFDVTTTTNEGGSATQEDGLKLLGIICSTAVLTPTNANVIVSGNSATGNADAAWGSNSFYDNTHSIQAPGEYVQFAISQPPALAGLTYNQNPTGHWGDNNFAVFAYSSSQLTWGMGSSPANADMISWSPDRKVRLLINTAQLIEFQVEDAPNSDMFTTFQTAPDEVTGPLYPFGTVGQSGSTVSDFVLCQ